MVEEKSILIIGDEANLRRSLAYIINRAGYQVTVAADGSEALDLLEHQPFDLIIVDLQLPDLAKIKLSGLIHHNKKNLPIIILTARPIIEIKNQSSLKMVSAYLEKPIEPADLLDRINKVFSNSKQIKQSIN